MSNIKQAKQARQRKPSEGEKVVSINDELTIIVKTPAVRKRYNPKPMPKSKSTSKTVVREKKTVVKSESKPKTSEPVKVPE